MTVSKVTAGKNKAAKTTARKVPTKANVEAAAEAKLQAEHDGQHLVRHSTQMDSAHASGAEGGSNSTLLVVGGLLAAGGIAAAAAGGGGDKIAVLQPNPPAPTPTYSVTSSVAAVNESGGTTTSVTFVITGTNVKAGDTIDWRIATGGAGQVSKDDIVGGVVEGKATFYGAGEAKVTIDLVADKLTEGKEVIVFSAGGQSKSVDVTDTSQTPAEITLTTADETIVGVSAAGTTFKASNTAAAGNAKGPTLNGGDDLSGAAGSTNNVLAITDEYGAGSDIMPAGLKLTNIQTVSLDTAGNAGSTPTGTNQDGLIGFQLNNYYGSGGYYYGYGAVGGSAFDTSKYSSVTSTVVNSTGARTDIVQASSASDIAVTHNAVSGGVATLGGNNVVVTTKGQGVNVGGYLSGSNQVLPTGTVTVNANGALGNAGYVTVQGGSSVNVNVSQSTATGSILIGNVPWGGSLADGTPDQKANNPTGAITVTSASTTNNDLVWIHGGSSVSVNVKGETVTVGDNTSAANAAANNTKGDITITDTAKVAYTNVGNLSGSYYAEAQIHAYGGKNVTINTNAGGVWVGGSTLAGDGVIDPTGAIKVTSTATDKVGANTAGIYVSGGASQTVTANNTSVAAGIGYGTNTTGDISVTQTGATHGYNLGTYASHYAYDPMANGGSGGYTMQNGIMPSIIVDGGAKVNVAAKGQTVLIGNTTSAANVASTGDITVTQSAVLTGRGLGNEFGTVTVNGGKAVTVTTTGGDVTVGSVVIPGTTVSGIPTGNVTITDTFGGLGNDAFSVLGGAAVAVTSTRTVGNFTVGNVASLDLNTTGTGLKNPTQAATGNVSYSSVDAKGLYEDGVINTKYGTGDATIFVNGATSVSLTGVQDATITDINTTVVAGGATAGTSKLASVSLTGYTGAQAIVSDALTSLSLKDGATAVTVTDNSATKHALALTLDNVTGSTITDNAINALTVTSGAAGSEATFTSSALATATFNNAQSLKLTLGDFAKLTTVTATGAGSLNLGNLANAAKLASIAAASASGAITVQIDPTVTAFTGGSGNDVVTITQYSTTTAANTINTVDGGTGSNTLVVNYAGTAGQTAGALYKNFSTLQVGTSGSGTFETVGFTALKVGSTGGAVVLDKVTAGTTLALTGGPVNNVTYTLATNTAADALALTIGNATAAVDYITPSKVLTATSIETLTVTSTGLGGNKLTIDDSALKTLKVEGTSSVTLASSNSAVSTVTAISTGSVNVAGVKLANAGVTATGGAGKLTIDLSNHTTPGIKTAVDKVVSGAGGVAVTLGSAGAWDVTTVNGSQNGVSYTGLRSSGTTTIDLSASTAVKDTITAADGNVSLTKGSAGGITGFTVVNSTASDSLVIDGTAASGQTAPLFAIKNVSTAANVGTVDANQLGLGFDPSGAFNAKLANLLYTASNGVITFSATVGHSMSEFTTADLLNAAELIVAYAGTTGADNQRAAAIVQAGGNTYVIAASDAAAGPVPTSLTQTITDPTMTVSGANAAGNITVVVNGVTITVALSGSGSATDVGNLIVTAVNTTVGVPGVTASNASGVVTFAGANTVSFGGAAATGVTATTTPKIVQTNDNNTIIELIGVTGVTGFGALQSANNIFTDSVQNNVASVRTNTGTATAAAYSAAGFSALTETSIPLGTTSTAVTGLASSAEVSFSSTDLKAVSITQAGAAGTNAIKVNLGGQTAGSLTLNGDWLAVLNASGSGGATLDKLADGGATATLKQVTITGTQAVAIKAITAGALTTIDASAATGGLKLGTHAAPLSLSSVTVKLEGGAGANEIYSTGNNLKLTQAVGANTGGLVAELIGNNHTISLASSAAQTNDLSLRGSGNVVSIDGVDGTTTIGGLADITGALTADGAATGSNLTLNIAGSDTVHAWVGSGAVVNLSIDDYLAEGDVTIKVAGDTYGSSGAYTVINDADFVLSDGVDNAITLDFTGTATNVALASASANGQVNVSGVSTLADALNLAASTTVDANGTVAGNTGLISWFHFNGDTYVVEVVNSTGVAATQTGIDSNDVVVKFSGLVDFSGATFSAANDTLMLGTLANPIT